MHSESTNRLDEVIGKLDEILTHLKSKDNKENVEDGSIQGDFKNFLSELDSIREDIEIGDTGYGSSVLHEKGYYQKMLEIYQLMDQPEAVEKFTQLIGHAATLNNMNRGQDETRGLPNLDKSMRKTIKSYKTLHLQKSEQSNELKEALFYQTLRALAGIEKVVRSSENYSALVQELEVIKALAENFEKANYAADNTNSILAAQRFVRVNQELVSKLDELKLKIDPEKPSQSPVAEIADVAPKIEKIEKPLMEQPLTKQELEDLSKLFKGNYERIVISSSSVKSEKLEKIGAITTIRDELEKLTKRSNKGKEIPSRAEFLTLLEKNRAELEKKRQTHKLLQSALTIISGGTFLLGKFVWSKIWTSRSQTAGVVQEAENIVKQTPGLRRK